MHTVHVGCSEVSVRQCFNFVWLLSGTPQRVLSYLVYTSTFNLVTFRGLTWLTGLEPGTKNLICTSYTSPFRRSWAELAALSIVYHCMPCETTSPFPSGSRQAIHADTYPIQIFKKPYDIPLYWLVHRDPYNDKLIIPVKLGTMGTHNLHFRGYNPYIGGLKHLSFFWGVQG